MIFSIAFVKEGEPVAGAAAGILWVAIAFSGTLALGRTFERERYSETLRALLLAPAPRAAIYVGKLLGMVVLMMAAEALLVPMIAFLFRAPLFAARCCWWRCWCWAQSDSRRSGRCSPRCWFAREPGMSCCRSCCIRSLFRS